jgi:transposase
MAHISGFERRQLLLLPEAVDDYVGSDNPVRFIDAFVDGLDLAAAGFGRVEAKATGRPGYAPGDLLKLYIYGYLNRVRSSRRLEAECRRNIEVIWLLRTLKPDFKTIADFRRDNRGAFKSVFRQFVLLCRRLDLYGRELLAVDGTRIKAVNNKDRNFTRNSLAKFTRAADERLDEYLKPLDEEDVGEDGMGGGARTNNLAEKIAALRDKRGRYAAMPRELERSGETQMSLTDPDSRAMAAHTKVAVDYNVQVAVDAKNKLIVEQAVTNQVVDQPSRGHGPADANRRARPRAPRSRNNRRRRRPRLLQERGHRGLREDRLRSPRSQAAARLLGARGLLPQGRVSLRRGARRLCLPGREGADADPPRPAARSRQSRLR